MRVFVDVLQSDRRKNGHNRWMRRRALPDWGLWVFTVAGGLLVLSFVIDASGLTLVSDFLAALAFFTIGGGILRTKGYWATLLSPSGSRVFVGVSSVIFLTLTVGTIWTSGNEARTARLAVHLLSVLVLVGIVATSTLVERRARSTFLPTAAD